MEKENINNTQFKNIVLAQKEAIERSKKPINKDYRTIADILKEAGVEIDNV